MDGIKKALGQHWLNDESVLNKIVEAAQVTKRDTILEVGPGPGSLTKKLVEKAGQVVAVELDSQLAGTLLAKVPASNLQVVNDDILKFDLSEMPSDYKVVANIPYYLTSKLIRILSEATNPPRVVVLLVQQEVAQRLCAAPGQMSLLAVSAQLYYQCRLSITVPAALFRPPPKVDSQVVVLTRRDKPLFANLDTNKYFQLVKAGFAGRRKKLRSSLSAGLRLTKPQADEILGKAGINGDLRAQNLSLEDWYKLYSAL